MLWLSSHLRLCRPNISISQTLLGTCVEVAVEFSMCPRLPGKWSREQGPGDGRTTESSRAVAAGRLPTCSRPSGATESILMAGPVCLTSIARLTEGRPHSHLSTRPRWNRGRADSEHVPCPQAKAFRLPGTGTARGIGARGPDRLLGAPARLAQAACCGQLLERAQEVSLPFPPMVGRDPRAPLPVMVMS